MPDRRFPRIPAASLLAPFLLIAAIGDAAAKDYIREERTVTVQGIQEVWQLVWDGKPSTVCGPDDVEIAITCPCSGFAYGEYGTLLLVRKRGGHDVERLDLRPLFGKFDYPDADKVEGTAYLQRWPLKEDDFTRAEKDPNVATEIIRRPAPTIMRFADFDHDGSATKFLLQVGTLPCGKHQFAAIGVSASEPHLHALASVAKPGKSLIMPLNAWQALLVNSKPHRVEVWACGDHGSDVRSEFVVSAKHGKIRVKARDFSCPTSKSPGKLIEETDQ